MKNILFILNPRAGSNLFNLINGSHSVGLLIDQSTRQLAENNILENPFIKNNKVNINGWEGTEDCYWMASNPSNICPCENFYINPADQVLKQNLSIDYFSWFLNMGDWWGDVDNHHQVPGPYDVKTITRFGPDELLSLPGNDWKFIYMIRDGRNQIESFRNIPGGFEEMKNKKDPVDYFFVLCKGWRNRARIALDCSNRFPNYKLIKFEDFTRDPITTMKEVYSFIGLEIDQNFMESTLDFQKEENFQKKHSSFNKDSKKFNSRFSNWTKWELEIFYEIAGKELKELGYEYPY